MKIKGIELKYGMRFEIDKLDRVMIYDKNDNEVYYEDSAGFWVKTAYDENDNEVYYEDSAGYWYKSECDENNNEIYWENSDGYGYKREYDENNNKVYYEDSDGKTIDNPPKKVKKMTMSELNEILGYNVEIIEKEKKDED